MPAITVKGMSCNHCRMSVTKALEALPGVSNVNVDLLSGKASFDAAEPLDPALGNRERIQVNDAFAEVADLAAYIEAERAALPEQNQHQMITSLKVDKDARMGLVTDVEQELRKVNALRMRRGI